jgi:hypothetical protein
VNADEIIADYRRMLDEAKALLARQDGIIARQEALLDYYCPLPIEEEVKAPVRPDYLRVVQ